MKLVAIYKLPSDTALFDDKYFNTHLPLVRKVPGLKRIDITRFTRTIAGEGFYLMAEMHFDDEAALKTGMRSPEMAAAGDNLNSFAPGLAVIMYGNEEAS